MTLWGVLGILPVVTAPSEEDGTRVSTAYLTFVFRSPFVHIMCSVLYLSGMPSTRCNDPGTPGRKWQLQRLAKGVLPPFSSDAREARRLGVRPVLGGSVLRVLYLWFPVAVVAGYLEHR